MTVLTQPLFGIHPRGCDSITIRLPWRIRYLRSRPFSEIVHRDYVARRNLTDSKRSRIIDTGLIGYAQVQFYSLSHLRAAVLIQ